MIIRNDQVDALSQVREKAFRDRLRRQVRMSLQQSGIAIEQNRLDLHVDSALASAPAWRIESERDLIRFTFLVIAFDAERVGGERPSWVDDILNGPGSAGARLDHLERLVQAAS